MIDSLNKTKVIKEELESLQSGINKRLTSDLQKRIRVLKYRNALNVTGKSEDQIIRILELTDWEIELQILLKISEKTLS